MVAAAVIALEEIKRVELAGAAVVVAVTVVAKSIVEAEVRLARVFKGVEGGDGHCSVEVLFLLTCLSVRVHCSVLLYFVVFLWVSDVVV